MRGSRTAAQWTAQTARVLVPGAHGRPERTEARAASRLCPKRAGRRNPAPRVPEKGAPHRRSAAGGFIFCPAIRIYANAKSKDRRLFRIAEFILPVRALSGTAGIRRRGKTPCGGNCAGRC